MSELDEMREKIAGVINGWGNISPDRRMKIADQILFLQINGYTLEEMILFFSAIDRDTEREAVVRKEHQMAFARADGTGNEKWYDGYKACMDDMEELGFVQGVKRDE